MTTVETAGVAVAARYSFPGANAVFANPAVTA